MRGLVERNAVDPDGFRDRNHRYSYLVACENARRLLEDPRYLVSARLHLQRFSRDDPAQRDGFALWSVLLDADPQSVAARLTERGERGDYTRETAPSFGGLPGPVRARLSRQAQEPLHAIASAVSVA